MGPVVHVDGLYWLESCLWAYRGEEGGGGFSDIFHSCAWIRGVEKLNGLEGIIGMWIFWLLCGELIIFIEIIRTKKISHILSGPRQLHLLKMAH
ncbi:hypothetical protein PanWU01x14_020350 [Parasponia andersonii]|uniref:Uncharacterized protein n=1 Tax=Parasponia andersonii TaxID=3476 RepID=A0A2P5DYQ2_PARAD|nr:hypothetical protein PanWU01x14_020350 [Parasponia andersonii]